MSDFDVQQLRAKLKSSRLSKKLWSPPALSDFGSGLFLCFDQTLTSTGVALIEGTENGPEVLETWMLKPTETDLKGFEKSFQKGLELGPLVGSIMDQWSVEVVHEMPAVGGYRIESSLLAALIIRQEALKRSLPVWTYGRQSVTALLAPVAERSSKAALKRRVEELLAPERRMVRYWNEHTVDATSLGLKHLHTIGKST